ncbi:MAG TPA: response regulator transcription factor [Blastocatellia bacterium]|nr:response regulator transcription factor [Blastocatellia bacterium]
MSSNVTEPIRILLVDDHRILRAGLRMLIEDQPGMTLIGEAGTRAEALALAARERPDIILLDLDLAGESSLDFLPELLATADRARVIILTGVRDLALHQRAIALGAMGLVLKDQTGETLIKAIEKVHAGEVWIDRVMTASVLAELAGAKAKKDDPEAAKIATLTEREREIIALVGEGLPNKQIASRLFISEKTVRNHLVSIYSKLEVSDRLELAIYASRHGLTRSSW